ncbi:glycosyltransferase family 2 protein [Chitinophaga barathri]|uniref:Glycosyltransferase family 2 protein n=1 Tax=Chitinophaga barathri TaxID=1647451 RepID=A0A3N4M9T9_9BACT|nr:glycosyltransferase family 2 protein [Chitinophaga barathri]RPD40482.1 glycosyltransferase family 2 protein [Chitinophaga barathri]
MASEEILGVIITFNPEIPALLGNLACITQQVTKVVIIDNHSSNWSQWKELAGNNAILIRNETNVGIAAALNQGLAFAAGNGFRYFISFDQDSSPGENMVAVLYQAFLQTGKHTAITGPVYEDFRLGASMNQHTISSAGVISPALTLITSGALYRTDIILSAGGFCEKLFIDYVDFELCLRLHQQNYLCYITRNAVLYHQLGNSGMRTFAGIRFIITNHSPLRRYYLIRNKIIIWKKYGVKLPGWVARDVLSTLKTIFGMLLFEKQRWSKFKSMIKGMINGITTSI